MTELFFKRDLALSYARQYRLTEPHRFSHDDPSVLLKLLRWLEDNEHIYRSDTIFDLLSEDLYHAVQERRYDLMCKILSWSDYIDLESGLHAACKIGDVDIARLLISIIGAMMYHPTLPRCISWLRRFEDILKY